MLRIREIIHTEVHFRRPLGNSPCAVLWFEDLHFQQAWGLFLFLFACRPWQATVFWSVYRHQSQRLERQGGLLTQLGTEVPNKPLFRARWAFSGFGFSIFPFIEPKEHTVIFLLSHEEESDKQLTLRFPNSLSTYRTLIKYLN